MYVCLCRRVTDRCVRAAIEAGAHDVDAVGRLSRAGTGCGGCRALLEALLAVAHADDDSEHSASRASAST